jgi:glycosyltransferase involved in cell wall biosynthesis
LPELVEDRQGGILCPPGDVQAFSEAINELAQDRSLRRQMGGFNRARVETMFTARRMTAAYAALFEEVMDRQSD